METVGVFKVAGVFVLELRPGNSFIPFRFKWPNGCRGSR